LNEFKFYFLLIINRLYLGIFGLDGRIVLEHTVDSKTEVNLDVSAFPKELIYST